MKAAETEKKLADRAKLGVQTRTATILRETAKKDERTVEIAFSSETPVSRWFGNEILDHGPKSVRLDRLRTDGPLLLQHNPDDQIGVVESVSIADRRGRAVVRFGRGQRADEIFQDVQDGIRKSISVGYAIHAMRLDEEADGVETYRATDWEPYEVSLVSIPADVNVGVGRAQECSIETIITRAAPVVAAEVKPAEIKEKPLEPSVTPPDVKSEREAAKRQERERIADIHALGKQHKRFELAAEFAAEGKSVEEFKSRLLEEVGKPAPADTGIGLTRKEVKEWSFFRLITALANPTNRAAQEAAKFEFECSAAAAKQRGQEAKGAIVPVDVIVSRKLAQRAQRDLTVGSATAGGNLVGTDILGGSFIEVLRASNPILRDATILNGLTGNVAIPRHSAATTAYWVAESGSPTEGAPTFDQVTLAPKTVGAYLDLSRQLVLQSSISMEDFAFMDLAAQLGLAMGSVAIQGGGSNEPTGILGTSGIGDVAGGTNGLAPTWVHLSNIKREVAKDNALMGLLKWYINSDTVAKLEQTERVATTGRFILDPDLSARTLGGYGYEETNLVPNNLTKGSSSGVCSAIIFGNMADLLIGMWGGLDIIVDPMTGSTSGTLRIVALQSCDVKPRHPQSFAAMKDALAA